MNQNTKQIFKIGILVAGILVIISTLLPFASVAGIVSVSLLLTDGSGMGDGILLVVFAVLAIVFAMINKAIPTLVAGILAFIMWIFEMVQMSRLGIYGSLVTKGAGFFLLIIAAIALLVLCVLFFLADRKSRN